VIQSQLELAPAATIGSFERAAKVYR
jgi:hypothetical protein